MKQQQQRGPRLQLIEARHARHLSQQELADRLGTTHVNVSRWERGITKPHPYFRRRLCQLFGKTETELGLLPSVVGISHDEPREVSSPVFKLTLSHGEEHIVVLLAVEENQLKLIS